MSELPIRAEVVIVGGGVIGLSVARALSWRGVDDLLLLERGGLGSESSFAAAGMLAPQAEADGADDFFHLSCRSRDMYPAFAEALRDESGIDIQLESTGTIYLAFSDHDVSELEKRFAWQTKAGLTLQLLSGEEARRLEPAISESASAALKFPRDIQVENRLLISALAAANEKKGVRMVTGATVGSLRIDRRGLTGVETSLGLVSTKTVVIASGAWTPFLGLTDESGQRATGKTLPDFGIEPVRGQMLCFESKPGVVRHVIYSPRGYVVPRMDGRMLSGSTSEYAGFDKSVTDDGVDSIHAAAHEISPRIGALPLRSSWAGLRPRAADGLPVLGPYAEIEGLSYATGHYRNGILLAPITGELLAAAIVDKEHSDLLSSFSPNRFDLVSLTS
jgi:glycine oxidase